MLKRFASISAVLILATAAFANPANARGGAHFGGHVGGAHFSGAHFGGRVGGAHFSGAHIGGVHFRGARVVGPAVSGRYHARYYAGGYHRYAPAYGVRYHGRYYGSSYYRYHHYAYPYRRYWPYWAAGAAWASAWPLFDGYAYDSYYEEPGYDRAIAYCMQRFRSYDPRTRTYLGFDRHRHNCP